MFAMVLLPNTGDAREGLKSVRDLWAKIELAEKCVDDKAVHARTR
jgi:hypothetical protein